MHKELTILERIFIRIKRTLIWKRGIYCKFGKNNHFSEGCILYEPAEIGNYNYFAPYTLVYNATIGNYCSIGPNCKIGLAEHNINAISTCSFINNGRERMKLFDFENPTKILNDVWLGSNVVIRQGVSIGNGAVIGANSVVISDIPDYAIAAGVPARILRKRFSDERINELLISRWFSYDLKKALHIVEQLNKHNQN